MKTRCKWAIDPLNKSYHDEEWGTPVHDDQKLFEFLILEGAQAGLSWTTILKKRKSYQKAFSNFNPKKVARFDSIKKKALLKNKGIIRNRLKIDSAITNAKAFIMVQQEFGSFDSYIWKFVGGKPILGERKRHKDIPTQTRESEMMSLDLKKRGFRFVGPTICYAFMQACGLANDHTFYCYKYKKVRKNS